MHYVYIVECRDGSLYTGWTTDPEKRVRAHNAGRGAKYTRSRGPVTLRYVEAFEEKSDALRREYQIKHTLTHEEKRELIRSAQAVITPARATASTGRA